MINLKLWVSFNQTRDLDTHHGEPAAGVRLVHIVAGRPGATPARARRRVVDDLHRIVSATESIASGAGPGPAWENDDEPYVLVCTNGRHDACCATFGRPIVRALRRSRWADRVWECSHMRAAIPFPCSAATTT